MKFTAKVIGLLALLGAVLAHAQLPTFQHVILVIQENRTPDNLFGGIPGSNGRPPFEPGVDIEQAPDAEQWCLGACFNPGHGNGDWKKQYNGGAYYPHGNSVTTSNCKSSKTTTTCNANPVCVYPNQCSYQVPQYPQDTYVSYTYDMTGSEHVLDPYVSIATQYGFANYFYQTNQGPSQSAHDFLFGGTSSPTGSSSGTNGQYLYDFVPGNPSPAPTNPTGCLAPQTQYRSLVNAAGKNFEKYYYPCFDHPTLSDLLESATPSLTWKYYTNSNGDIWTAPNGISHICEPTGSPLQCQTGSDFSKHVVLNGATQNSPQPILSDISNCQLQNVSWVIPNGDWSDHPGFISGTQSSMEIEGGPNWVADIVNAVGQSFNNSGGKCDYWKAQPTVIFVVWDDWGGWYDHMGAGYEVNTSSCWPICQLWGEGYTYGFRVPLLVVSAYTQDGTVSGACGGMGQVPCPNNVFPYQHDFGGLLAFIEYNFFGSDYIGQINPGYPFADAYAPEIVHDPSIIPLTEFFTLSTPKSFETITTVNNSFTLDYFKNYNGPVVDPDNDAVDPQD